MNRNSVSAIGQNPSIDVKRSKFNVPFDHKTTMNAGSLYPIYFQEIYPGDTLQLDEKAVIRMSTPFFPVMDNAYLDTYYFFVPNRLTWSHFKEFMGENTTDKWTQTVERNVPFLNAPEGGWQKGTIADHFCVPTQVPGISVNALPFRAYCLIWNEWFRDQNLKDPCNVNLDDADQTGSNDGDYQINAQFGALPLKVAKFHDYFTSCLPEPQKGPDVLLPLGDVAPVGALDQFHEYGNGVLGFRNMLGGSPWSGARSLAIMGQDTFGNRPYYVGGSNSGTTLVDTSQYALTPENLWADLSQAVGSSINALRKAFAVQRYYERNARGGTRYRELIKAHFGATSPDATQQIPEYLGGKRTPINIQQVVQTSAGIETEGLNQTPLGQTSAFSFTSYNQSLFTKSFTEHGWVIGVACIRTDRTYQQGIDRSFSRRTLFDYYFPVFANIGEQAVLNKEIYAQGTDEDDEVFGYQEAWADLRYGKHRVSGAFRSNYATSLDSWHYADDYDALPVLSSEWIDEPVSNVDRTLRVTSAIEDQFIVDFFADCKMTRAMPVHSIPGLIDHN